MMAKGERYKEPAALEQGLWLRDRDLRHRRQKLSYKGSYSGLTGPATAAHFHGPAESGNNAAVQIPVFSDTTAKSPFEGEATLTDAQASDLMAGKWYFNIHTAANKGGEIRGQVIK